MKYKWHIQETEEISRDFLDIAYGSKVIAKLLLNRGINSVEAARAYLNPKFYIESSFEDIPDLLKAKERIIQAINKDEKITIFGDYDVDGVTATCCLLITLKQFTNNIDFYIPNRLTEGYGLNIEAVKTIATKHKTKLLITCDCGITNQKEIELANELGMDVIVTDHHALPEILPPACAVLNPKILPEEHKLHYLPGVGVAYELAQAIFQTLGRLPHSTDIENIELLDLVALGMIADLAPLVNENRYLVQIGLEKLAKTQKIGLQELLKMCGLGANNTTSTAPNPEHIGFGIAPRINAVGRLTNASLAVQLLTTNDLLEAVNISCELDTQNKERQFICEETLKEATEMVKEQKQQNKDKKDKCIILAKEGWHHGVVGIVASRIVEKFHLPTILIAVDNEQNIARGSGRSIGQLDIVSALYANSTYLEKFGGHKAACGLSIKPANITNFISEFTAYVNNLLGNTDIDPILKIDSELPLKDLNKEFLEKIFKLSPFGFGNPMPVFASELVEVVGIRTIGKNNQHLKLVVKVDNDVQTFGALIWNFDNSTQFNLGDKVKLAYTPKFNTFNGETFIQLEVKDWDLELSIRLPEPKPLKDIEIYDFRGEPQKCLTTFSPYTSPVTYFAEVMQKDYLPLKTSSRTKIEKTQSLVFLETPPDEFIFLDIIQRSQAKQIYLGFSEQRQNPQSFAVTTLKKLIGMLKYASNYKNSGINELDLQSALGINRMTLAYGLEILVKTGFLSYKRAGNELNINLNNLTRQNFNELLEYNLFVSEIKQILDFKQWFSEVDLDAITKMLNEHNLQAITALAK